MTISEAAATGIGGGSSADLIDSSQRIDVKATADALAGNEASAGFFFSGADTQAKADATTTAVGINADGSPAGSPESDGDAAITNANQLVAVAEGTAQGWTHSDGATFDISGDGTSRSIANASGVAAGIRAGDGANTIANNGSIAATARASTVKTVTLDTVVCWTGQREHCVPGQKQGRHGSVPGDGRRRAAAALFSLTGELHASASRALLRTGNRFFAASIDRQLSARSVKGERKTIWADAFGFTGRVDADGTAAAARYRAAGLTVGVDLVAGEDSRLGAAFGFSPGSTELNAPGGGSAEVRSYHPSVYGDTRFGRWHVGGGFGYSRHEVETSREIHFGAIARRASADYEADQYSGLVRGAFDLRRSPRLSLQAVGVLWYSRLARDGFTEEGAESVNLTGVSGARTESLRSIAGIRTSWAPNPRGGTGAAGAAGGLGARNARCARRADGIAGRRTRIDRMGAVHHPRRARSARQRARDARRPCRHCGGRPGVRRLRRLPRHHGRRTRFRRGLPVELVGWMVKRASSCCKIPPPRN